MEKKFYNLIFPIWVLLFFPPVIFITLLGNFIIDSLVVILCFYVFKLKATSKDLKTFYKKSIFKVWGFGFLADALGAAFLFILAMSSDSLGLSDKLTTGINYDPFSHWGAVLLILTAIFIAGVLIYVFNFKYTFRELIEEKTLRIKVAVTIALITLPWTFLLPTKWFYHGF